MELAFRLDMCYNKGRVKNSTGGETMKKQPKQKWPKPVCGTPWLKWDKGGCSLDWVSLGRLKTSWLCADILNDLLGIRPSKKRRIRGLLFDRKPSHLKAIHIKLLLDKDYYHVYWTQHLRTKAKTIRGIPRPFRWSYIFVAFSNLLYKKLFMGSRRVVWYGWFAVEVRK